MLTAVASGAVAAIGLLNIRVAALLFVWLLPFLPRSLGIALGSEGGSLTFSRISIPLLIMLYIAKTRSPGRASFGANFSFVKKLFAILVALSLLKIISAAYNGTAVVYAIDDAVRTTGIFALFFYLGHRLSFEKLTGVFVTALFISFFLASVELGLQRPLHAGIANESVLASTLTGSFRDGQYRVQALFDGVLFFSEFIVLSFAAFLHFRPRLPRVFQIAMFAVFGFLLFANGSRSVMATGLVILAWAAFLHYWRRARSLGRSTSLLVLIIIVVTATFVGIGYIQDMGGGGNIDFLYTMDSFARSSTARAFQFIQVGSILQDSPLLGIGFQQSFVGDDALLTLDNYYIRVALESGIIGLALLILFFVVLFSNLLRLIAKSRSPRTTRLASSLLLLTVAFLSFRFFFQDPSGVIFYFLLLGAGLRELALSAETTPNTVNAASTQEARAYSCTNI